MCFTFKKNNKQTKKPVNCFLQDDASAGIQSLQTSIDIKLCESPWNGLHFVQKGESIVLTLPLPEGVEPTPKGFSSITFEKHKLETRNFA